VQLGRGLLLALTMAVNRAAGPTCPGQSDGLACRSQHRSSSSKTSLGRTSEQCIPTHGSCLELGTIQHQQGRWAVALPPCWGGVCLCLLAWGMMPNVAFRCFSKEPLGVGELCLSKHSVLTASRSQCPHLWCQQRCAFVVTTVGSRVAFYSKKGLCS
jgi:hypothetical protein